MIWVSGLVIGIRFLQEGIGSDGEVGYVAKEMGSPCLATQEIK